MVITVAADSQTTIIPTTLTFTSANWNTAQTVTVTAVDDTYAEGPHTSTIHHSAASTDTNYNGIAITNVTAGVVDNDTAAVTITQSGGSTSVTEGGATDSYTVVLGTPPTADVVITVAADSQTTIIPTTLTFTSANWNTAQTVTVTAVDDAYAEGPHNSTIHHSAASTDTNYNGIAIADITADVADNDTAGVLITETGGNTTVREGGSTDSFTVALNARPTSTVTLTVLTDSQCSVDVSTLTFTSSDWNTPQTVTVTAADDAYAEGRHKSIIHFNVTSNDATFSGISVSPVNITIEDNDIAGVTISESGGTTQVNEQGSTSDSFTVVLKSPPLDNVVINIKVDSQTTVDQSSLTFTPANWNSPQVVNVTAIDDNVAEGAHTSTIQFSAVSTDLAYNGFTIPNLLVGVTDNDIAGITLTETSGSTDVNEAGPSSDTYSIVLNRPPTTDVVITISHDSQITVDNSSLTFTTSNWNIPQIVTVTAVDDSIAEGQHTSTITHTSSSIDPNYNGIVISNVNVNVTDNDSAAVIISEPNGSTSVNEAGPTSDIYTVVLSIAPTSNVTITVDPDIQSSVGAGAGQPINLLFTPTNWNVPQTVTVTAVDDLAAEGMHFTVITHTATSSDPNYNGISIRNITASVIDNDTAGVTITQSDGTTEVDETGPTSDTYTVVLTIPPTSNVNILASPDIQCDVGAGPGQPITLVFTSVNWNVPQTVTVTAVDDAIAEGAHHSSTITHTASSSDPNYNGITINSVTPIVTDNDTSGVAITESGKTTILTEGDTVGDSYTVVLKTPPTADVTITVSPDDQTDAGAGAGETVNLEFTTTNWNTPQTVTVHAVDDLLAEGLHHSTINHFAASSDSNYNGITIKNVIATIYDNDIPGVVFTETGGSTEVNEEGSTVDSYTVVLTTQPTMDVMISVLPDASCEVTPSVLNFTPENWNVPQAVTVNAIDDIYAEGYHKSIIAHRITSADLVYNCLPVRDLAVFVTDNDAAGVTIAETNGSTLISETGPTSDTYTVVLNTPPKNNVVVTVDPDEDSDVGAGGGVEKTFTFTPANWNIPQTVTITAVDDPYAEGEHYSTIQHTASSADDAYNRITIRSVIATVTDNDTRGISVIETDGGTEVDSEGTITDTYDLVLSIQPTANVNIIVMPDSSLDIGAGRGVSITLTFTPANWNVRQTVAIKANNPNTETARIRHMTYSTDASYRLTEIDDVVVHITYESSPCIMSSLIPFIVLPFFALMLVGKMSRDSCSFL